MNCKYCESKMVLDDTDFNFKGNQDNYWMFECCGASAFEKIRFGHSVFVAFRQKEDE